MMVSVICCYNNYEVMNNMLITSLENQRSSYELILVDNSDNKFRSAAQALNYGLRKAKGDYIFFVHQDVEFVNTDFLEEIVSYIKKLGDDVLCGVAGRVDNVGVYTNIRHSTTNDYAGEYRVNEPVKVQTFDEVLIACKRNIFDMISFDENTCDDWHLYGVDLCLSAKLVGINSYIIPVELYHKSSGDITYGFIRTLNKLIKKHKRNYDKINTTCVYLDTTFAKSSEYLLKLLWFHVVKKSIQRFRLPSGEGRA